MRSEGICKGDSGIYIHGIWDDMSLICGDSKDGAGTIP